ncbi:copper chaperone PCu(A)C [Microbacterium sp. LMI1-1-1.1]|uniref:copper chaperone PCu(A)C n=1 Tax=unclassified Microbacterium TaxID=2609290 RepID=UPI0034669899
MSLRTLSVRVLPAVAVSVVAALALSGCAGGEASTTPVPEAAAFHATDAWVKAAPADEMTAAFGELVNDGDNDITVVSATSPAASMIELHETVQNESGQSVMREVEGGFTIPAHSTRELAPGADHLMIMGATAPLLAGEEVTITLTFSDDSTAEITAPVKEFAGANETYEGGDQ